LGHTDKLSLSGQKQKQNQEELNEIIKEIKVTDFLQRFVDYGNREKRIDELSGKIECLQREFENMKEVLSYVERAKNETIDSLYKHAKQITEDYNDQKKEKVILLAIDIIWS
jgi:hypothetical protein